MSLPGTKNAADPVGMVCNLASLFTVCAHALNDLKDWSDEVRERSTQDIKHVLELGAVMAVDAAIKVEEAVDAPKRMTGGERNG